MTRIEWKPFISEGRVIPKERRYITAGGVAEFTSALASGYMLVRVVAERWFA